MSNVDDTKIATPNVVLLSHTPNPEELIYTAARQCYSAMTGEDIQKQIAEGSVSKEKVDELLRRVIFSGHTSVAEHATFTFAISGVSRNFTHQFVRHRIASHSQQSQCYVNSDGFQSVVPFRIKSSERATALYLKHAEECNRVYNELINILVEEGHDAGKCAEDARYILHSGIETKIIATFNARSLFNFFAHRCCMRAMNETRKVADMMMKLVTDIAPTLFETTGAPCEFSGFCPELEKFSCGRYPSIHSDPVKSAMSAACKNFI